MKIEIFSYTDERIEPRESYVNDGYEYVVTFRMILVWFLLTVNLY